MNKAYIKPGGLFISDRPVYVILKDFGFYFTAFSVLCFLFYVSAKTFPFSRSIQGLLRITGKQGAVYFASVHAE